MGKQYSDKACLAYAKVKAVPVSPTKARSVANNIRRQPCHKALAVLESMPQKTSRFLKKLLHSAMANARSKEGEVPVSNLLICELRVDEGPSRMRIWYRSKGRADRLKRRSSHIYLALDKRS